MWTNQFRKGTALFIAATMLFNFPAKLPAAPATPLKVLSDLDLKKFSVPAKFGKVDEVFLGTQPKSVLLIQDAHAIPDAQKNIGKLIDHFVSSYGIQDIRLEGAASSIDTQLWRSFPNKDLLKKVMKGYAEQGELAGGNAAAIFGAPADFRGMEDWKLYEEGLRLYQKASEALPSIDKELNLRQDDLNREKKEKYPAQLFEIDSIVEKFLSDKGDLADLLKKLSQIEKPQADSQIETILSKMQSQTQSHSSLDVEVKALSSQVEKLLNAKATQEGMKPIIMEFQEKKQAFLTGSLRAEEFGLFLTETLKKFGKTAELSSAFGQSVAMEARFKQLEGTQLFRDLEKYIGEVKAKLLVKNEFKVLDQRTYELRLFKKLSRLELTREEWHQFEDMRPASEDSQMLKASMAFYANAAKRDQVLLKNALASSKGSTVVMVAGGFHARGFTEELKVQGISYAVVMPQIKTLPDANSYQAQMQGNLSWKEYFRVENGRVSVYDAFVRATRDQLLEQGEKKGNATLLKDWRDEVIRDLSDQDRLTEAEEYLKYFDEVAENQKKAFVARGMKKIEDFIAGIKKLDADKQLDQEHVQNLLMASRVASLAGPAASSPADLVAADLVGRSESRLKSLIVAASFGVAALMNANAQEARLNVNNLGGGTVLISGTTGSLPNLSWNLQSKLDLNSTNWVNMPGQIGLPSETAFFEMVSSTNRTDFYRLEGNPKPARAALAAASTATTVNIPVNIQAVPAEKGTDIILGGHDFKTNETYSVSISTDGVNWIKQEAVVDTENDTVTFTTAEPKLAIRIQQTEKKGAVRSEARGLLVSSLSSSPEDLLNAKIQKILPSRFQVELIKSWILSIDKLNKTQPVWGKAAILASLAMSFTAFGLRAAGSSAVVFGWIGLANVAVLTIASVFLDLLEFNPRDKLAHAIEVNFEALEKTVRELERTGPTAKQQASLDKWLARLEDSIKLFHDVTDMKNSVQVDQMENYFYRQFPIFTRIDALKTSRSENRRTSRWALIDKQGTVTARVLKGYAEVFLGAIGMTILSAFGAEVLRGYFVDGSLTRSELSGIGMLGFVGAVIAGAVQGFYVWWKNPPGIVALTQERNISWQVLYQLNGLVGGHQYNLEIRKRNWLDPISSIGSWMRINRIHSPEMKVVVKSLLQDMDIKAFNPKVTFHRTFSGNESAYIELVLGKGKTLRFILEGLEKPRPHHHVLVSAVMIESGKAEIRLRNAAFTPTPYQVASQIDYLKNDPALAEWFARSEFRDLNQELTDVRDAAKELLFSFQRKGDADKSGIPEMRTQIEQAEKELKREGKTTRGRVARSILNFIEAMTAEKPNMHIAYSWIKSVSNEMGKGNEIEQSMREIFKVQPEATQYYWLNLVVQESFSILNRLAEEKTGVEKPGRMLVTLPEIEDLRGEIAEIEKNLNREDGTSRGKMTRALLDFLVAAIKNSKEDADKALSAFNPLLEKLVTEEPKRQEINALITQVNPTRSENRPPRINQFGSYDELVGKLMGDYRPENPNEEGGYFDESHALYGTTDPTGPYEIQLSHMDVFYGMWHTHPPGMGSGYASEPDIWASLGRAINGLHESIIVTSEATYSLSNPEVLKGSRDFALLDSLLDVTNSLGSPTPGMDLFQKFLDHADGVYPGFMQAVMFGTLIGLLQDDLKQKFGSSEYHKIWIQLANHLGLKVKIIQKEASGSLKVEEKLPVKNASSEWKIKPESLRRHMIDAIMQRFLMHYGDWQSEGVPKISNDAVKKRQFLVAIYSLYDGLARRNLIQYTGYLDKKIPQVFAERFSPVLDAGGIPVADLRKAIKLLPVARSEAREVITSRSQGLKPGDQIFGYTTRAYVMTANYHHLVVIAPADPATDQTVTAKWVDAAGEKISETVVPMDGLITQNCTVIRSARSEARYIAPDIEAATEGLDWFIQNGKAQSEISQEHLEKAIRDQRIQPVIKTPLPPASIQAGIELLLETGVIRVARISNTGEVSYTFTRRPIQGVGLSMPTVIANAKAEDKKRVTDFLDRHIGSEPIPLAFDLRKLVKTLKSGSFSRNPADFFDARAKTQSLLANEQTGQGRIEFIQNDDRGSFTVTVKHPQLNNATRFWVLENIAEEVKNGIQAVVKTEFGASRTKNIVAFVRRSEARMIVVEDVLEASARAIGELRKPHIQALLVESLLEIPVTRDYRKAVEQWFQDNVSVLAGTSFPLASRSTQRLLGSVQPGANLMGEPDPVTLFSIFGVDVSFQRKNGEIVKTLTLEEAKKIISRLADYLQLRMQVKDRQIFSPLARDVLEASEIAVTELRRPDVQDSLILSLLSVSVDLDDGGSSIEKWIKKKVLELTGTSFPLASRNTSGLVGVNQSGINLMGESNPVTEYSLFGIRVSYQRQNGEIVKALTSEEARTIISRLADHIENRSRSEARVVTVEQNTGGQGIVVKINEDGEIEKITATDMRDLIRKLESKWAITAFSYSAAEQKIRVGYRPPEESVASFNDLPALQKVLQNHINLRDRGAMWAEVKTKHEGLKLPIAFDLFADDSTRFELKLLNSGNLQMGRSQELTYTVEKSSESLGVIRVSLNGDGKVSQITAKAHDSVWQEVFDGIEALLPSSGMKWDVTHAIFNSIVYARSESRPKIAPQFTPQQIFEALRDYGKSSSVVSGMLRETEAMITAATGVGPEEIDLAKVDREALRNEALQFLGEIDQLPAQYESEFLSKGLDLLSLSEVRPTDASFLEVLRNKYGDRFGEERVIQSLFRVISKIKGAASPAFAEDMIHRLRKSYVGYRYTSGWLPEARFKLNLDQLGFTREAYPQLPEGLFSIRTEASGAVVVDEVPRVFRSESRAQNWLIPLGDKFRFNPFGAIIPQFQQIQFRLGNLADTAGFKELQIYWNDDQGWFSITREALKAHLIQGTTLPAGETATITNVESFALEPRGQDTILRLEFDNGHPTAFVHLSNLVKELAGTRSLINPPEKAPPTKRSSAGAKDVVKALAKIIIGVVKLKDWQIAADVVTVIREAGMDEFVSGLRAAANLLLLEEFRERFDLPKVNPAGYVSRPALALFLGRSSSQFRSSGETKPIVRIAHDMMNDVNTLAKSKAAEFALRKVAALVQLQFTPIGNVARNREMVEAVTSLGGVMLPAKSLSDAAKGEEGRMGVLLNQIPESMDPVLKGIVIDSTGLEETSDFNLLVAEYYTRYMIAAGIYSSKKEITDLNAGDFERLLAQLGLSGIARLEGGRIVVSRQGLSEKMRSEFRAQQAVRQAA